MHYSHLLTAFASTPWALLEEKLISMRLFLLRKAKGEEIPHEEIKAAMAENRASTPRTSGRVAVLPIVGTIIHRGTQLEESCGMPSCQLIGKRFDAMMDDPGVKTIVLDIESPGGSVYGVQELGQKIANAKGQKKVVASVNALAASGAFWIASQAAEIWMTPTGHVGSVGVFVAHEDISKALESAGVNLTMVSAGKYKTEGVGPLTEEARAHLQSEVDRYYEMFCQALASGRDTTVTKVKKDFGEGRVVGAKQAKAVGMIDKIGTLQELLQSLGVSVSGGGSMQAETPFNRLKAELDLAEVA